MDISTLLSTTRAMLVGWRTFAGTGIGPPSESEKTPVAGCTRCVLPLPTSGGPDVPVIVVGETVESIRVVSAVADCWLITKAISTKHPIITTIAAIIHFHRV